eukprot:389414-Prorocentrum_minimum.AAC.2
MSVLFRIQLTAFRPRACAGAGPSVLFLLLPEDSKEALQVRRCELRPKLPRAYDTGTPNHLARALVRMFQLLMFTRISGHADNLQTPCVALQCCTWPVSEVSPTSLKLPREYPLPDFASCTNISFPL